MMKGCYQGENKKARSLACIIDFKHEKSLYDKRKGYSSDIGRSGGIRTHDLFHPKEALYQAEPRPESQGVLYRFIGILSTLFYKLF